ncbi:MAG: type II CRISPR-associated endonuclease Cas1 [bacterium]
MLKRTLVFATACHLCIRNGQLIHRPRGDDAKETVIPMEDIGVVMLEDLSVTMSGHALWRLNEQGAAVVLCDERHHPCAMLQSLEGNTTHAEVLRAQLSATQATTKRLWQQTVKAKIGNQAALLELLNRPGAEALKRMADMVKTGDVDNREAVASRQYWSRLFDLAAFVRDPDGSAPNGLLNYGYAILRAAAARALVSSGLYCAIGIHHCNRYNAFALADDFMEPYRPFVDAAVVRLLSRGADGSMTREAKQALLNVLTADASFPDKRRPLMNAMSLSSASLVRCLAGEERQLHYPSIQ